MSDGSKKKRHNLRDVASQAGVSVATVSRVLNSPQQVSPETRNRVEAVMTDLRFVPSAAARAINSGRTRMVAALLPTLDNSIYSRLVDGLENRLADFDLSLIVAQTGDDQARHLSRARQLIDIGAEGFIVAGVTHSTEFLNLVEHIQIPTVAVSYFDEDATLPTIGYNNWEAAQAAARHLIDLGHEEIAVVHGPLHNNDRTRQRRGAIQAMQDNATFRFFETVISMQGGCDAAIDLLAAPQNTTAVLCFSDVLAMGVLNELWRCDVDVPKDLSVMGIENLPSSKVTYPTLTSVRLQVQEMGERAAEAIAEWLEHGNRPKPANLAVELIRRQSTARPRK